MDRRSFLSRLGGLAGISLVGVTSACGPDPDDVSHYTMAGSSQRQIEPLHKSEEEWRSILSSEEFRVLRREGTERRNSSPLNEETRAGTYVCAGCFLPLFSSETKYDSGTGWPSFWKPLEGHVATKRDYSLVIPRTEYHCARCGGHQGHVFNDGPEPTGHRWCNNGVALRFIPEGEHLPTLRM